jgi:glycosyltransferase involved in cell wall biosynthesis
LPPYVPARKRPLRVLHVGNIANNAYVNAKLLRRAGVEADALCDEWRIFCQPEWEDAELGGDFDADARLRPGAAAGWTKPDWALRPQGLDPQSGRAQWANGHLHVLSDLPRLVRRRKELSRAYAPLRPILGSDLGLLDLARVSLWKQALEQQVGSLSALFARYDVVELNGAYPAFIPLGLPRVPYVAFEHGTMRELPFEDTARGRLLALGYRQAAKVIITNPDVVAQARRLGVENYVFVPHPLDEEKYRPGPSQLRAELEAEGVDFVLLCPSRHDWHIKGSDRMLRAFAELVRADSPKALLILNEWGADVERSRALVNELGISRNVRWLRPLPKLRLMDAYRAADVVLDQFLVGTFGAVAPEAMACGIPVVMAFESEIHRWCFPELPPVVDARTPEQIYAALRRLAEDQAELARLGRQGRDWIERNHGWRLVVDRHLAIYEEVLGADRALTLS